SSPCFKMNAFWASENFDAFISSAPLPSQENHAENSNSKRSSFLGAEHQTQGLSSKLEGTRVSGHTVTCQFSPPNK
ncbi:MAG: hypothetical protein RIM72_18165, partial [Alphaproteobacteria bacterium]